MDRHRQIDRSCSVPSSVDLLEMDSDWVCPMTSWAVSQWAGFSDTEEIRLYTEFASCNVKHPAKTYTGTTLSLKQNRCTHSNLNKEKFLTCPLRCSALAGLCIGASPGGGDGVWACAWLWTPESRRPLRVVWDTDCNIRSVENPEQGTEREGYIIIINNIWGLKEPALTWCVSCWTKRTGP